MSDIEVLVHFGFPKTGSSTLQYGLFKPLHDKGIVNLRTWRQEDPDEHLDRRPSSRLFTSQDMLDESINFISGKLNILSDESFTAPYCLRRYNYGDDIKDPFEFPALIKEQITNKYGDNVKFKCLMVIRNHSSLIYSQYVEEYNLKKYKDADILFDSNGDLDLSGYDIYRFYQYYMTLSEVFGESSVELLLFEHWKQYFDEFSIKLSELLSVSHNTVMEYLSSSHVNKKKKSEAGYYTKDGETLIPFLSSDQKNTIRQYFSDDTNMLQEILGESVDLKSLGY